MDHSLRKFFEIRFTVKNYLVTSSSNSYSSYEVRLRFSCNFNVEYKITSSLQNLTLSERTVDLYLKDIPNGDKALYHFGDFICEPTDCCWLREYKVLNDLDP